MPDVYIRTALPLLGQSQCGPNVRENDSIGSRRLVSQTLSKDTTGISRLQVVDFIGTFVRDSQQRTRSGHKSALYHDSYKNIDLTISLLGLRTCSDWPIHPGRDH